MRLVFGAFSFVKNVTMFVPENIDGKIRVIEDPFNKGGHRLAFVVANESKIDKELHSCNTEHKN